MISYDVCVAISELTSVLVQVRKYICTNKPLSYDDDYDKSWGNHSIELYNSGYIGLARLTPKLEFIVSIDVCNCVSSLYGGNTKHAGWRYDFADPKESQNFQFHAYDCDDNSNLYDDIYTIPLPTNEEDFEGACFQLCTLLDPQTASIMMAYNFTLPVLEGTGMKLYCTSTLFQLSANEIRRMTNLVNRQFDIIKNLKVQNDL